YSARYCSAASSLAVPILLDERARRAILKSSFIQSGASDQDITSLFGHFEVNQLGKPGGSISTLLIALTGGRAGRLIFGRQDCSNNLRLGSLECLSHHRTKAVHSFWALNPFSSASLTSQVVSSSSTPSI